MAEIDNGQSSQASEARAFSVPLSDADASDRIEPDEDEPGNDADESSEPVTAEAQEAPADDGSPADDVQFDPDNPAHVAAMAELRKQVNVKWQKRVETLKKNLQTPKPEDGTTAPEIQPTQQTEAPVSGLNDFYADPFGDDWKPEGVVGFDKDSDLAGYQDELDAFVTARVKKAVQHTLATMGQRGAQFEQVQQERQAAGVIEGYVKSLENHPEYESLYAQLAEIAPGTKDLAIKNPQKWVQMAAGLLGVPPDWQEAEDVADTAAAVQRGQQSQKLARKPLAAVQRPTRANGPSQTHQSGTMALDDALNLAFKKAGIR